MFKGPEFAVKPARARHALLLSVKPPGARNYQLIGEVVQTSLAGGVSFSAYPINSRARERTAAALSRYLERNESALLGALGAACVK